jgi:predicted RNase H-like HicB family nuclease
MPESSCAELVTVRPRVKVVLEQGERHWSAYVPSIPGCIATARTKTGIRRKIASALSFHLEGLHELAVEEETDELRGQPTSGHQ